MKRFGKFAAAMLLACVLAMCLGACQDNKEITGVGTYVYDVIEEVPAGETYEADGVSIAVENVNVELAKDHYRLTFDLKTKLPDKAYLEKYAYADGRHISVYPNQLQDGYGQLYTIRESDGSFFVEVYPEQETITDEHAFQLEVALQEWNGGSVVFDLT